MYAGSRSSMATSDTEGLQSVLDVLRRPVAGRGVGLIAECRQQRCVPDAVGVGDVGIEHVHPFQQRVVEFAQLRVLESAPPVVGHQPVVCFDGKEPVCVDLMGMHGQKVVRRGDCHAEVTRQQAVFYQQECLVFRHNRQ